MELMGMLQIAFVESSWGNRLGNGKTGEREKKTNSWDCFHLWRWFWRQIHCGWTTESLHTGRGECAGGNLGRHLGTDVTQLPTGGSCDAEGNL